MYKKNLRRPRSTSRFSKAFVQRLSSWLVLSTALTVGIQQATEAATETWNQTNAGTYGWNTGANWVSNSFPNAISDSALLNIDIAGNQILQFNIPITLGNLTIGDTSGQSSYLLEANGGSLTMDNGGTATINKVGIGVDIISSNVAIAAGNTLAIDVTSGILVQTGVLSGGVNATPVLDKTGDGLLILRGTNTYLGTTTLNGGTTLLANFANSSAALGATGGGNDTVVNSGATLASGPINAGSGGGNFGDILTINGDGFRNLGAIRGFMGANTTTFSGQITLGSAARIHNDQAGSMTLSGQIITSNNTLTVGGVVGTINLTGIMDTAGASGDINHYGINNLQLSNVTAGHIYTGTINSSLGEIRSNTGTATASLNPYNDIAALNLRNSWLRLAFGSAAGGAGDAPNSRFSTTAPINMRASQIYIENSAFSATSTNFFDYAVVQAFGTATIVGGHNRIGFRSADTGSVTMTFANIVNPNPETTLELFVDSLSGAALGTSAKHRIINSTIGADVPFVGGWAYTYTGTTGTGAEFVKYDFTGGNGYTAVTGSPTAITGAAAGDNVRRTTAESGFGTITINSLNIAGGVTIGNSTDNLTLASGGLLSSSGTNTVAAATLTSGSGVLYDIAVASHNISSDITGPIALVKTGTGTTSYLTGNSYTGTTYINEGQFRGVIGSNANALGTGNLTFAGSPNSQATFETDNNFIRPLGTGVGEVQFLGGGGVGGGSTGFSAYGAPISVNFNNDGSTVTWGSATFNPGIFTLNGGNGTHVVTLVNDLDLGGEQRYIRLDGTGPAAERAVMGIIAGDIDNGGVIKRGGGTLIFENAKSYEAGTIVNQGALWLRGAGTAGANVTSNDIQVAPDGYLRIESPTNIGDRQMIILQNNDNTTPAVVSFGAGYGTGSDIVFNSLTATGGLPSTGGNNVLIANNQSGQARRIAVTISGNQDFQADLMAQVIAVAPFVEAWFGADNGYGTFTGATLSPSGGTGVQTGTLLTAPAYRFGGHTNNGGTLTITNANVITDTALGVPTPVIVGAINATDVNYTDGTLYLPQAQSFTGRITIGQGGLLQAGVNGSLGGGGVINNLINLQGGELRLDHVKGQFGGQAGTQYSARNIDVTGGTGTIRTTTLQGAAFNSTAVNNLTFDANRTLQLFTIGTNFTDLVVNNITFANSANTITLAIGSDNSFQTGIGMMTVNGIIGDQATGAQTLAKNNGGVLILNNANTYDGGTSITQGRVVLSNTSAAGTGTISLATAGGRTSAIEYRINGAGPFLFNNAITTTGGNDTSTRIITVGPVSAGSEDKVVQVPSLTIGHAGAFTVNSSGSSAIFFDGFNGYRTTVTGAVGVNRSIVINTRGALTTFDGVVSGVVANEFQKSGEGTLVLNGANTYLGPTTLNQGYLVLGNDAALGAAVTDVTIRNNVFSQVLASGARTISRNFINTATGSVQTIGGLDAGAKTFSGGINLSTRGMALTAITGGDTTFSGVISGGAGFGIEKLGNGTVILNPSTGTGNTYSGTTTVTQGTLIGQAQATSGSPFGTGATSVSNAELRLQGIAATTTSTTTTGALTIAGGAVIRINNVTGGNATQLAHGSLARTGTGTVTFVPGSGALGTDEVFTFTAAPALVNTIVGPWAVAATSGANNAADYVTMSGSTVVVAGYTGTGDLDGVGGSTDVWNAGVTGGTLTAPRSVFAFRTDANVNLAGFTLNVGDNGTPANGAGIILNNGADLIGAGASQVQIGNTALSLYVDDAAASSLNVPIANTRDNSNNTLATVLTKFGPGTLDIGAVQTFQGNVELVRGTMNLNVANAFQMFTNLNASTGATVTISPNTTLNLNNNNQEFGNLASINTSNAFQFSGGTLDLGTADLTVGRQGSSMTFDGQLIGLAGSSLVKVGGGTLTLTNLNGNKPNSLDTLVVSQGAVAAWVNDQSWATPTPVASAIPSTTTIILNGGTYRALAIGDSTSNQQRINVGNSIIHQGANSILTTDRATGSGSNKLLVFDDLTLDVQLFQVTGGNSFMPRFDGTTTLTNHARLQTDTAVVLAGAVTDGGNGYTLNKIGGSDLSLGGDSSLTWTGGTVVTGGTLIFGSRGTDDVRYPGTTLVNLATSNAGTGDIIVNLGSAIRVSAPSNILSAQGQEVRIISADRVSGTRVDLLTDAAFTDYNLRSLSDGSVALGLNEGLWTTPIDLKTMGNGQWSVSALTPTYYTAATMGADTLNRYLFAGSNAATLDIVYDNVLTGTASVEVGRSPIFAGTAPANSGAVIRLNGTQDYTGNTTVFRSASGGSIGSILEITGSIASPVIDVYGRFGLRGAGRVTDDAGNQVNTVNLRPGGNLRMDYAMSVADSFIIPRLPNSNLGTTATENKWADGTPMVLDGAGLNLISSDSRVNQETVGAITIKGGAGITLERAGTGQMVLRTPSITRTGQATLAIRNTTVAELGSINIQSQKLFITGAAPAQTNGMVAPWMVNLSGRNFLSYNTTTGFTNAPFAPATPVAGGGDAYLSTFTGTEIVQFAGAWGDTTLTSTKNVYAFRVDEESGTNDMIFNGGQINIWSGGLILGSDDSNRVDFNTTAVYFGNGTTPVEGIVYGGHSTPNSRFGGVVTAANLTFDGPGGFQMTNAANAISGTIQLNGGRLYVDGVGALGGASQIILHSDYANNFNGNQMADLRLRHDSTTANYSGLTVTIGENVPEATIQAERFTGAGTATLVQFNALNILGTNGPAGTLVRMTNSNSTTEVTGTTTIGGTSPVGFNVSGGNTWRLIGSITSAVPITKTGTTTLRFDGNNTAFTGGFVLNAGEWRVQSNPAANYNVGGTGDLELNFGTVRMAQNGASSVFNAPNQDITVNGQVTFITDRDGGTSGANRTIGTDGGVLGSTNFFRVNESPYVVFQAASFGDDITLEGQVVIDGSPTFRVDSVDLFLNDVVQGNGTFNKAGINLLHFNNNLPNTFTGGFNNFTGITAVRQEFSTLGTGPVQVFAGTALSVFDTSQLGSGLTKVLGSATAVPVIGGRFIAPTYALSTKFNSLTAAAAAAYDGAGNGVLGIDAGQNMVFDPLMATRDGGAFNLWNLGSSEGGGTLSTNALTPWGAGGTEYRLGGGFSTLTANPLTPGSDQLSGGGNSLIVGVTNAVGGFGTLVIDQNANNSFGGGTTVNRGRNIDGQYRAAALTVRGGNSLGTLRTSLGTGVVNVWGELRFENVAGTAANAPGGLNTNTFVLNPGSRMRFDNSTAFTGTGSAGRWQDNAPITLNSAVLDMLGGNSTSAFNSETVGDITVQDGSEVAIRRQTQSAELIAGNLLRVGTGTLMLRHDANALGINSTPVTTSGANVDRFIVANGLTLMNNNMVDPWVVSRSQNQFLKYDASAGFQLITEGGAPANYLTSAGGAINAGTLPANNGTEILDLNTANATLALNPDIHALRTDRSINTSADSAFKQMTIRSGAIINLTNTVTINPDVYFGLGGTGDALLWVNSGTLQINGKIFANDVIKAGVNTLNIQSDQTQFAGDWIINGGAVQFLTQNAASTGEVIINGNHLADSDSVYNLAGVLYNFNSQSPDLFTWGGGKITVNDYGFVRSVATNDRVDQLPAIDLKTKGGAGAQSVVFLQSDASRHTTRTGTVTLYDNYIISTDATSFGPGSTSGVQLGAGNGTGGLNNQGLYDVVLSGDGILSLGDNSASFTGAHTITLGDASVRVLHNGAFGAGTVTATTRSTGAIEIAVPNFVSTATLVQEAGSIERWAVSNARGNTGTYNLPSGVHLQVFSDIGTPTSRTIGLDGGSIMGYQPLDYDEIAVIQTIRSGVTINLLSDSFLGQVYPAGTSNGANHFIYDMGKLNTTTNLDPSNPGLRGSYLVIDGNITGNFTLTKVGQDMIKLAGTGSTFDGLDIQDGIIQVGANNALPTDVVVTTRGAGLSGLLDLNGYDQMIGGLEGPSGSVNNSAFGYNTLTINTNPSHSYAGSINGTINLVKSGASMQTLTGVSGYLGSTTVTGGALRAVDGVGLPANTNLSLNGGAFEPLTGTTFTRALGTGAGQVQLPGGISGFGGSGATTTINLPGTAVWGTATFNPSALQLNDANATAALIYASPIDLNSGFGIVTRTFRVDSATQAATLTGALSDSGFGTAHIAKAGAGRLIIPLATSLGYNGNTTVSGGTLQFNGNRNLGGDVTVAAGGTLSIQDGVISTLTLTDGAGVNLTIGGGLGNPGGLAFDYNSTAVTFDNIAVGQQLFMNAGGGTVSLNNLGAGILPDGTYSLMSYLAGSTVFDGAFTFLGGGISQNVGGGKSYTLDTTGTSLNLIVGNYAAVGGFYFKGGEGTVWNTIGGGGNSNWINGPTLGSNTFALPGAGNDVFISANVASNLNTTLGQDFSIKGLTFTGSGTSASGGVTVSGNTLTVGVDGISVAAGAGVNTISSNILLGGSQTWTNVSGNGNALNITSSSVTLAGNNLSLAGTDPINISSFVNLASTLTYTGESTATLSGITFGSGDLAVAATGAPTTWGSLAFWPVNAGQLTVSGNALYTGSTTVTSGTLRLDNGLTSSSGIALADDTLLQAQGTISVPVTTTGANDAGSIQAVGPLVLQNSTGAFDFAGLIDTQSNIVQVVAPVRSTLDFINLENGANISAGNGLKMPDGDGGSSFLPGLQKGLITLTGSATIGGDIQLGTVSGDAVDVFGVSGTDTLTFTGVIRGGISAPGVTIDISQAINRLGFSPSFNPFTSNIQSNAVLEADTNTPYGIGAYTTTNGFPQPKPSPTAVDGSNYTQYLSYGYDQISGSGNNDTNGLITINAHAAGSYSWAASSTVGITGPSQSFTFFRTDGHNWPNYTSSGNIGPAANRNGVYVLQDGSLAGFTNMTIASFSGLPALPAGQSWQVESTNKYIRLYIQGFLPMGNGSWKNGAGNQLWSTNSAADNNWAGGQPSSVGQIATFDNTVTNYAGGAVNVDLPETIGGLQLSDSGSGGYNFSGSPLTLTNGTILSGVVTYTDPTINVNSGTHSIANTVAIGNGNAGGANGLVVTTAPGSRLNMSGNISSGFTVGNAITKEGAGVLVLSGAANTYTGHTHINAGVVEVSGSINGVANVAANVNVNAAGTLTGTGTLNTGRLLNVNGGTVSPGLTGPNELTAGVNQLGTLNALGGASFASGSTFKLDLQTPSTGGSDNGVNDKLNVTGAITLNGTINIALTLGYVPAGGDLFFIALNDGVDPIGGTFAFNVPDAGGQQWVATAFANAATGQFTGGNDIAVMAVIPEPNTLSMLMGSLSLAVGLQRFRRRRQS